MVEVPTDPALVSVIVPIYNHARFLRSCLDSVAGETYPLMELIVIDDGSTDGSFDVATEWSRQNASRFVRVEVSKQENAGLTRTLNRLLRMARGEFVVLLASDDILLAGGILERVQALLSNPQWLAVFGDCTVINDAGETVHQSGLYDVYRADKIALQNQLTIETELVWRWSVPGPVLMVRRAAYFIDGGIGLYPEDLRVEDRWFYLTALSKRALGFIDVKVAGYRIHSTQTIAQNGGAIGGEHLITEARLASQFSGFSAVALWVPAAILCLQKCGFIGRIPLAILYRARNQLRKAVLAANSKRSRQIATANMAQLTYVPSILDDHGLVRDLMSDGDISPRKKEL